MKTIEGLKASLDNWKHSIKVERNKIEITLFRPDLDLISKLNLVDLEV